MHDMTGLKFMRWTVLEYKGRSHNYNDLWLCECECGTQRILAGYRLRRGATGSCGCLSAELTRIRNGTHRMSKSTEYTIWCGMMGRCYDSNNEAYKDYGGRGIFVDARWHNFDNFLEDVGKRPKGHQLDRIDNNSGYSNKNCKWSTPLQNCRNRRNTLFLTVDGVSLPLTEWADKVGVSSKILWERLQYGWSHKDIVYRPVRKVSRPDAYLDAKNDR